MTGWNLHSCYEKATHELHLVFLSFVFCNQWQSSRIMRGSILFTDLEIHFFTKWSRNPLRCHAPLWCDTIWDDLLKCHTMVLLCTLTLKSGHYNKSVGHTWYSNASNRFPSNLWNSLAGWNWIHPKPNLLSSHQFTGTRMFATHL